MHVTICIATRARGDTIDTLLRSILVLNYGDWDAVIVDQSPDTSTETAVRRIVAEDKRFRYVRSSSVGSSIARNIAITWARGPIIACTDDDCEVAPDWLDRVVEYIRADERVGLLYGRVHAAPHDPRKGFVPDYQIRRPIRITSPWLMWRQGGIGANMVFSRDALQAVGPFDEVLGAGAPLFANLDGDMTYRMLRAGFAVLCVPDATVVHHGYREWDAGRPMMRRVGIGVGATYMKYLRLGDIAILPTLFIEWFRCVAWRRLLLFRHHTGLGRFAGYGLGMVLSLRYRIDRVKRVYVPRESAARAVAANTAAVAGGVGSAVFLGSVHRSDGDGHAMDAGALIGDPGSLYDLGINISAWLPLLGTLLVVLSIALTLRIRRQSTSADTSPQVIMRPPPHLPAL